MKALLHDDPELGIERWCLRCAEWWPLDGTFWYFEPKRPGAAHCKACWNETKRANDERKAAIRSSGRCVSCGVVLTFKKECHGCAGRRLGL